MTRVFLIVIVALLVTASAGLAEIDSRAATATANALIGQINGYTALHPREPGAVPGWAGCHAGEPLAVHSYPDLHVFEYLVPVLNAAEAPVSLICLDAHSGRWIWHSTQYPFAAFPEVSRDTAAAAIGLNPQDVVCVRTPSREMFWYHRTDAAEHFVGLHDANRILSEQTKATEGLLTARDLHPPDVGPAGESPSLPAARDSDLPTSFNLGVPHYYQSNGYYCGPAALAMVFDYWGPTIPQSEIATVAKTNSTDGTYATDLVRASHFSSASTVGSLTGYTARSAGYAAYHNMWDYYRGVNRVSDIKGLICNGCPVLVLTWYDTNYNSGHFRVVKGYDDNSGTNGIYIVHDPWYSNPYQGPNVHFDQVAFDDLWTHNTGTDDMVRWGMVARPWVWSMSDALYCIHAGQPNRGYLTLDAEYPLPGACFTATGVNANYCPQYPVSDTGARLTLSQQYDFNPGCTTTQALSIATYADMDSATWCFVDKPSPISGRHSASPWAWVSAEVYGTVSGTSANYTNYSDAIGYGASVPVCNANCAWAGVAGRPVHTAFSPTSSPPCVDQIAAPPAGPPPSGPCMDDAGNMVYIDSESGAGKGGIWSVSPDGHLNWYVTELGNNMRGGVIRGPRGFMYVATGKWDANAPGANTLLAIDPRVGTIIDTEPLDNPADGYAVYDPYGDMLFVHAGPKLYGYWIESDGRLERLWVKSVTNPGYSTGAPPVIIDDQGRTILYLSTRSSSPSRSNLRAYVVTQASAEELWSLPIGDARFQPILGWDGTIYCATLSTVGAQTLSAVRPDGTMRWSLETGYSHPGPASIGPDGTLYIGTTNGKLVAVSDDGDSAHVKWVFDLGTNDPVTATALTCPDSTLYIGSKMVFYALRDSHDHAEILWTLPTQAEINATAALDREGRMLVATRSGPNPGDDAVIYRISPDTEAAPPDGWVNPGWNWLSIPLDPVEADAGVIFGWENVENLLFRWDPSAKTVELCPDDFRSLELGRGYQLWADVDVAGFVHGRPTTTPFALAVPEAGCQWVGHTGLDAVPMKALAIRREDTGEMRTAVEDWDAPDPWLNWNWVYWDSFADTARMVGISGCDDASLRPWHGYRIWANRPSLSIVIPAN